MSADTRREEPSVSGLGEVDEAAFSGLAVPDRDQRLPGPARQAPPGGPATGGEVLWLQPYPDRLLDELPADNDDEPETVAVARETIRRDHDVPRRPVPAARPAGAPARG